jgi:hypothetical protein
MANGLVSCKLCGRTAAPGSAVLLAFGANGRIHKKCLPEGQYTLADGVPYTHRVTQRLKGRPASVLAQYTPSGAGAESNV